jgi:hypothetical protein
MKLIKLSIMLTAIALLFIAGCEEDESVYPTEPTAAMATTDASGEAELDFGSHLITVKAVDFIPQAISNITVIGYLLKDYLYIFAVGNDVFYSNHKLVPYSEMSADAGLPYGKPSAPQTIEDNVEITLQRITRDIYAYTEEPEYQDSILIDEWATPVTYEGTISDVYALADSICKDRNIIIHITDDVAAQTNPSTQTVALVMDSSTITSDTVFSALIGLEFHVFDADTLSITYFDYGDSTLAVIFIDDIGMAGGSFFAQFTLTWGELPDDLDSHLWTPNIEGSTYHVFFGDKGSITEPPYAFLDVDDVTSWGPEHIVIQQTFPGTYYYSVHHFAGESTIPVSNAKVTLLKPDRTIQEFSPPNAVDTGEGWYWHVCTIDGATGEVTEVGTMNQDPPVPGMAPQRLPSKSH